MATATETLRDLQPLLDTVESLVARHALGPPGAYSRWTLPNESGQSDLGINPYGCADAVNLLYTLGKLPSRPEERSAWVDTLQGLQDPEDGLFHEETHHPIHTTVAIHFRHHDIQKDQIRWGFATGRLECFPAVFGRQHFIERFK